MPVQPGFAQYCSELLSAMGDVRGKRMFGGYGMYIDEVFVAIIAGETLYLKADAQTQSHFVDAGCSRFEYTARGERHVTSYWSVPPDAMDSPVAMAPWARLALEAALRAKKKTRRS
jgi:DNA transformation protein and related proteins